MTSLNISLPEVLKAYVEGQVATGDWGTPSEYIRELIRQDKERRMTNLEQELLAAAKGPKIEVSISQIRKKGLISALRERARRARKNRGLLSVMQRLQIFWSSLIGTKLKQIGVWRNVGKRRSPLRCCGLLNVRELGHAVASRQTNFVAPAACRSQVSPNT